jgi:hypothetical protein
MGGALLLVALLGSVATVAAPPPVPATPAPVKNLLVIRPFSLAEPYEHLWRLERPIVSSGYVIVVEVDPLLVIPRQAAEPVLYVGDQTAQRINPGDRSGRVVAIVPGKIDFSSAPIWFGTPELPEQVDARTIREERRLADRAGIRPFPAETIAAARAAGGDAVRLPDMKALLRSVVAPLIMEHAPQDKRIAEAFLVPRAQ